MLKREMTDSITAPVDPAFKSVKKNSTAFLIWRIENLNVVPVPKDQYGTFYEGDSYIIYAASEYGKYVGPKIKFQEVKGPLEMHIHFWLGADTSQDESAIAAYKTVELDDYLSGNPIQHREVQGSESPRFKSYFKNGLRLLRGGVSSGLNHVADNFEPRLFRVKGRRIPIVQQMPSISWEHFNKQDVFIIDTNDVIFVWVGSDANNIEKLQATKIAMQLKEEHSAVSIVFMDDGKESKLPESERLLLGIYLDLSPAARQAIRKTSEDDQMTEYMERNALKLYQCSDDDGTYKVTEIKSGPLLQSDLKSDDSYIIDNGAKGVWVWIGKKASIKERVEAMRNAYGFVKKKLYPASTPINRVVESGEPMEFKALFLNWVNKEPFSNHKRTSVLRKAKTVVPKLDAESLQASPNLAAETQLVDDGSGSVTVWRVDKTDLIELPKESYGTFYSGDCYLVHYVYSASGKERHILYYWVGLQSSATEQTALAFHTVEKDNQLNNVNLAQVRLVQGKESPHFLAIFKGKMMTFSGEYQKTMPSKFLLQVIGNRPYNTRATEVKFQASSLNSNDVFVLFFNGSCFVWCGKGSTGDEREMAKSIAQSIDNTDHVVVYEGQEKYDFWEAVGGKEPYAFDKRLAEPENIIPARLFHCSNATGAFKVEEIINFTQTDLVVEDVMLLDSKTAVFLWIGSQSNKEERSQALQLAYDYLRTDPVGRDVHTPIYQIREGYEPPNFTGFFGAWNPQLWKSYKSFQEIRHELENLKPVLQVELRMTNGTQDFDDCEKHPIDILLQRDPDKLPSGVDPLHKELYLSHDDFISAFGMKYSDFSILPKWRQENLKKAAGLF
ncbi:villin like protein quail isoform X2 [Lycorma delicatula]